ncbi:MAG: HlyD family secretion protein [Polyangiaceae bacterium]
MVANDSTDAPGASDGAAQVAPPPPAPAARPGRSRRGLVIGLALLAIAGAGGGYWATHHTLETTDDAQLDGEVVAVPTKAGGTIAHVYFVDNQYVHAGDVLASLDDAPARARMRQAEARVAVAEASLHAAEASLAIATSNATGNNKVASAAVKTATMGALTASDQIKEAEAAVKSTDAAFKQASLDVERDKNLFDSGAIPRAALDRTTTALELAKANQEAARARLSTLRLSQAQAESRVVEASAKAEQVSDVETLVGDARARVLTSQAEVDSAKAALDLAALDVKYTEIIAPADGIVSKKTIAEGQAVAAGQTVVQLIKPALWVGANFKETQITHMRTGQPVTIKVDAFPTLVLEGEIESFAGATGSRFALLPPDNASGNFTKVVQRMPVRIKLSGEPPAGYELRPGMSVEVTVDTR